MRLSSWLESRGLGLDVARRLLAKPLPANVAWMHTLGSLALLYLAFQMLTGALLGLYYAPSLADAYPSVRYVREELFLGELLHSLHRTGAGFVLVTAVLHMLRSYFLGAYKAPRELLWVSGMVLLTLLLGFAFTGQLLPFDQRGYWATVVGLRIVSSAPLVGEGVKDLLTGGYGDIGPVTLSRFYLAHVSVLPLVLALFTALHVAILQRVGSAGPTDGSTMVTRPFYPWQATKDVVVCALGALALVACAALVGSADSGPANPGAGDYVPRPEWYFLGHYQLLKLLPASLQIVGTFVLPAALALFLVLLPFLDRRAERRPAKRPLVVGAGVLGCIAIGGLTVFDLATHEEPVAEESEPLPPVPEMFAEKECLECHMYQGEGGELGPKLDNTGVRLRPEYLEAFLRDPARFDADTEMPAFEGTEEELQAIVRFLLDARG